MLNHRSSGILLHPTSLPGRFGSGDMGESAYRFIDWLKSAGQRYWQMLPLGEIGPGNSPYMSCSAFAGNILLIDLLELVQQGWLQPQELQTDEPLADTCVDFSRVVPLRMAHLRRAAANFFAQANHTSQQEYQLFCTAQASWLNDYALFKTIEGLQQGCGWNHWPTGLAQRDSTALAQITAQQGEELGFWKFCQWCFMRQWAVLKNYANSQGVSIIGDVPIFVAYQSADVWAHQELFELDAQGHATLVAGVPPDYFSATGQLWGNPLYRWERHEQTGYAWWVARLGHALTQFDLVRIDHFRGFAAYWAVPAQAETAIDGHWLPGPGSKLFAAFLAAFGSLPIIAEDLGLITPDVIALRDEFALPGMRILQFAFGDGEANHFLPHHYVANTVAYTGTHDNDTTVGWWQTLPPHEKDFALRYLTCDGHQIHLDMMRALSRSVANTVIFPLQDVLGLGGEHRMNFPGQGQGNWGWRFSWQQVLPEHAAFLAALSQEYARGEPTSAD